MLAGVAIAGSSVSSVFIIIPYLLYLAVFVVLTYFIIKFIRKVNRALDKYLDK